jgi:hypothetical protein
MVLDFISVIRKLSQNINTKNFQGGLKEVSGGLSPPLAPPLDPTSDNFLSESDPKESDRILPEVVGFLSECVELYGVSCRIRQDPMVGLLVLGSFVFTSTLSLSLLSLSLMMIFILFVFSLVSYVLLYLSAVSLLCFVSRKNE